jgi:hypothetical protein
MILFTNGCSWTYGGGLNLDAAEQEKQRKASTWPAHLGELMGASEVVNLAEGCGSNDRILRTTFDWLNQQTPERLKETIAIIQWTEASRYEYYCPETKEWARCKIGVCLQTEEDINVALSRSEGRLETFTDEEGMYKLMNAHAAMESIFRHFGVKYYYWSLCSVHAMGGSSIESYLSETYNWVKETYSESVCMRWDYDIVGKSIWGYDLHPSFTGHKQIAQTIYDAIR